GGTVLYLQGPLAAMAARERLQGTQEALAGSHLSLVALDSHLAEDSAEEGVRKWLRMKTTEGTRVALVAGQDDAMARGARRAFEAAADVTAAGGDVPFLGFDGAPRRG